MNTRTCDHCQQEFLAIRPHQRFCSDNCRGAHHRLNPNPLERAGEFSLTLANPNPSFKTRKDGDHYFVEFEMQRDEWDYFTDPNVNRQGMVIEATCSVAHLAQPKPEAEVKGGPLAELAGRWCRDDQFRQWADVSDESTAREYILSTCGIQSRKELDHNAQAARIFHERIRNPFNRYTLGGR